MTEIYCVAYLEMLHRLSDCIDDARAVTAQYRRAAIGKVGSFATQFGVDGIDARCLEPHTDLAFALERGLWKIDEPQDVGFADRSHRDCLHEDTCLLVGIQLP